MKQLNAEADVPNTAGDYSQWKKLPVTQNEYVHEIYKLVSCSVWNSCSSAVKPFIDPFILYVRSF